MGVWGWEQQELISALGRRLIIDSGDPRSIFFLRQRIDIAIQRGNALFVLAHGFCFICTPPPLVIYTLSPAKFKFVFCLTFIFPCLHVFCYPGRECLKMLGFTNPKL